ncbi:hypothetical protein BGZ63DRAFT_67735 [Mariannaea sp. PMI_226]|nr:hypothetical protein BGZ63DRAFT_67735 [Mariannaea sp. PMI_226]
MWESSSSVESDCSVRPLLKHRSTCVKKKKHSLNKCGGVISSSREYLRKKPLDDNPYIRPSHYHRPRSAPTAPEQEKPRAPPISKTHPPTIYYIVPKPTSTLIPLTLHHSPLPLPNAPPASLLLAILPHKGGSSSYSKSPRPPPRRP